MKDFPHEERLLEAARVVRARSPARKIKGAPVAGLDLGTADVVFLVLDETGAPVCGYLEWSEVVRDGVVVDFAGARRIVRKMVEDAEAALGQSIESCSTGYPPGTDPDLSVNVVRDAGLRIAAVLDEPTAAATALGIRDGIVVDIGGGTTGISILQEGKVRYSADEATGGRHLSLVLAGAYKISYDEAERRKRSGEGRQFLNVVRPVIEKMASIVQAHIRGASESLPIVLVGGTPQLEGFKEIFEEELARPVTVPQEPLFATPLGIALSGLPARRASPSPVAQGCAV
ncbi:MAG: hypothetical protein A3G34_10810 [Candidatus Lindowbacteria bacterium RIFCSPLOWO2_12_FULL_62_27]|nr:MAG: hypothetical protein A3G34_10810 [Candidatus Lindowbacteria bacterium RIFCSPLOWO2_12_FULL_62_27]